MRISFWTGSRELSHYTNAGTLGVLHLLTWATNPLFKTLNMDLNHTVESSFFAVMKVNGALSTKLINSANDS